MTAVLPRNRLLAALPAEDLERLRPHLMLVPLIRGRILHHPYLPIEQVYFVEEGLVSVEIRTDGGRYAVQAWLIGQDGMVGLPAVLGQESSPHRRIVLAPGMAWRLRSADLRWAMERLPSLRAVLLRYADGALVQVGQMAACNARHTLQQRLARWLLMAQDRLGHDELPVSQNVVARLLGVRRASVSVTLQALAQTGALAPAERGHIRVLDRPKLCTLACHCYVAIRAEFERCARAVDVAGQPRFDDLRLVSGHGHDGPPGPVDGVQAQAIESGRRHRGFS